MPDDITYEEIIHALANYVYAYSHEQSGYVINDHYACNGFDLAPDILERVKMMASSNPYQSSWFTVEWTPGQKLPIFRNREEASIGEIAIALVTAVRWGFKEGETPLTEIQSSIPHKNPAPGMHHFSYAIWTIAQCLEKIELGAFIENNYFKLNEKGDAIPDYWEYWTNDNIKRRGNRKRLSKHSIKALRNKGIIKPPKYW